MINAISSTVFWRQIAIINRRIALRAAELTLD